MVSEARPIEADDLVGPAVDLVTDWLRVAGTSRSERTVARRLARLMEDPEAVAFTMRFIDRVARPENAEVAAGQLARLVARHGTPGFLAPVDRALLRAGAGVARALPRIVIPLAQARMRSLVGHLIADADREKLRQHLDERRAAGYAMNVNLLGEAILGEREAHGRYERTKELISRPGVDYVSVKITSIASQLDLWAYDESLDRISDRLAGLYDAAAAAEPATFVNLDMEAYEDVDLTIDAFTRVLATRPDLPAGIVLQAYLPDTYPRLQELVAWANARHANGGAPIRIRLVKGANLAMERVTSELHGWPQAPYESKPEVDANFKRCLDWVLQPDRLAGLSIGVGSHNLFDLAWASLLARHRAVHDRLHIEMLQGMAPEHADVVKQYAGEVLLYTPVVAASDFDVAVGYLFRRLEENAAPENFLRALFGLTPGTPTFVAQANAFASSVAQRWDLPDSPRRTGVRPSPDPEVFENEPDTDPAVPANRNWAERIVATPPTPVVTPITTDPAAIAEILDRSRAAGTNWFRRRADERRQVLLNVAEQLARRRGDLISAMVHEAGKTFAQADPEVSEAIDFARYYGLGSLDGATSESGTFQPLGVVAVVPPWNFPVAIAAGGVLAALAAGNSVIFKPAPETPRCAEIVAEACWEAEVPADVLQFVRTRDDDAGQALVTGADGVILTGSWDTARLFRGWAPNMRLFAETSGKNAIIVTPHADLDLAAHDVAQSAFGHAGQKCSAASLAILVGPVGQSERFRRQLLDATESMVVGYPTELASTIGPLIGPPRGPLEQALADREARWLLPPRQLDETGRLWSPGILEQVEPGSWFHRTECFGPVLGLMAAPDLDRAIELQNSSEFGLTGGIHTLDPTEIEHWLEAVDVGNAYVNRHITGAIVQRQPFGGRKRSSVGPGAKAGGPNYVRQLGTWLSPDVSDRPGVPIEAKQLDLLERLAPALDGAELAWLTRVARDDQHWWETEFGVAHDPSGLRVESNVFRYQPRPVAIRAEDTTDAILARCLLGASRVGLVPTVSTGRPRGILDAAGIDVVLEDFETLVDRLPRWTSIRYLGQPSAAQLTLAHAHDIEVAAEPVAASGRVELIRYLQEQSISRTMHRFGNLL